MAGRSRSKRPRAPPPAAVALTSGPASTDALACGTSKRPRTAPSTVVGGDLISGLGDDVLLRVIQLLPDARDAMRTGALSRRWRGLWTRVPALRFASTFGRAAGDGDVRRYVAFVDAALALRAAQTAEHAIEHLGISFSVANGDNDNATRGLSRAVDEQIVTTTSLVRDARRWIRYAARHAVKSFVLELHPLLTFGTRYVRHQCKKTMKKRLVNLDGILPSSSKLEAMRLAVHGAVIQLPATAVFASLTDLSLEGMRVEVQDRDGNLLARLVSSACCPRLQKLHLIDLDLELPAPGLKQQLLLLECGVLSELSLKDIGHLQSLELRTPSLRALHMDGACCDLRALTLSAPRLEELTVTNRPCLKVYSHGDLPCVAKLKIDLWSHDCYLDYDHLNATSFYLLQRCRFARCLVVRLKIPQVSSTETVVDGG